MTQDKTSSGIAIRALTVFTVVGMVIAAGAGASTAGKLKKKQRTVEATYVGGPGVFGVPCPPPAGCVIFNVEPGERDVEIEIKDRSGQPIAASVYLYGYTDGFDDHEHMCGTSGRLQLGGVKSLVVVIDSVLGAMIACPGPATTGTVVATFSRR